MSEWYGALPERWETKRIGVLFAENTQSNVALISDTPMQFRYGEIIRKKKTEKDEAFLEGIKRYNVVQPNDIMVNGLNLNYDFVTQRVAIVKEVGCMTPAYISMRPKEQIDPAYACYLLKSMDGQKILNGLGTGIRLTLSFKEFKKTPLPFPPRLEQDKIVRFLDWKVSQINKLINAKKKQIGLLQEQKRVVINAAVTKGGEEWKEVSLGNLGDFRKGSGGSREDDDENGAACIRYGDIYRSGKMMLSEPITRIKHEATTRYARVAVGEILFALSGETKEEIGQALVNDIAEETWTSGDAAIFTAGENINSHFLTYVLRCPYIVAQRASLAKGDIIVHISVGALRQLRIAVPPVTEQIVIVERLNKICTATDKTVTGVEREISLLHEYRTRLISDVVTGKLDVRDAVVPEYEAVEETAESEDIEGEEELDAEAGDV